MISVEGLSKSYGGGRFAVRDLSFAVARGEVVGFLGPNGAGKTTTLRMVSGFLGATDGRVQVGGSSVDDEPTRARGLVGYMPESVPLYPEMRVREYLAYRAELKGVVRRERRAAVARALERTDTADVAETLIGHLSRGYRQRVGLADALVADPPVLILDEPTAGLDPNQIRQVRGLVRELGRDHAVLFSTHILPEVEAICDRAVVIAKGRLVAQGTIDELRALRRSPGVRIVLGHPPPEEVVALVEQAVPATRVLVNGAELTVELGGDSADGARAIEDVTRLLAQAGCGMRAVLPAAASLEDVFSSLTRDIEGGTEPGGPAAEPGAAPVPVGGAP